MKKLFIALAGTALLGLASMSAPAVAMPAQGFDIGTVSSTETVQLRRHNMRPRVCHTERVVRRGPHGRRIVTTRRACR
jgi:hypothetical protein